MQKQGTQHVLPASGDAQHVHMCQRRGVYMTNVQDNIIYSSGFACKELRIFHSLHRRELPCHHSVHKRLSRQTASRQIAWRLPTYQRKAWSVMA